MRKIVHILLSASLLYATSCEVLEQEPQASLPPEAVIVDAAGTQAALIGAYSALQSTNYWGLRYFALSGLYADEISHTGTFPSFLQVANRNVLPDNVEFSNIWNSIYAGINRANNIIAQVPSVTDEALDQEAAIGEARFLRAFHYFNLIRMFGGSAEGFGKSGGLGVPLFLEPTLTPADAEPKPRASEEEVLSVIIADLEYAMENLPASAANGRVDAEAATALMARLMLYIENYDAAQTLAEAVIAGDGSDLVEYFDIFEQQNTSEAIWELQFDEVNSNSIAFFFFPTNAGGRNEIAPSNELEAAHEEGDLRLAVNAPGNGITLKYNNITNGDDHVLLIRKAEMYLIAAEAAARQGETETALEYLNAVRNRAGLDDFESENASEIVDAVMQERFVELAMEGHRFFDLRRTGRAVSELELEDGNRTRLPIPQREVLTSEDVVQQNPGY